MLQVPPFDPGRRTFLGHGALGLGALGSGALGVGSSGVGSSILGSSGRRTPGDGPRGAGATSRAVRGPFDVGVLGLGRAGMRRIAEFLEMPGCRIHAVCDVDEVRQDVARRRIDRAYGNKECNTYSDYRDLLRAEDLDAVVVATPDHWHALMIVAAFRKGLDVYCESPLTLSIDEGREIERVARATGRIVQTGMVWRSDPVARRLVELVRDGWLGPIRRVRGELDFGRTFARIARKARPVPDGFHYDLWLGPAPAAPYHPKRCSGYRWIRDYAGGRLTGQGLVAVDLAQWMLGRDGSGPASVTARAEYPKVGLFDNAVRFVADFAYPDGVKLQLATTGRHAVTIEGARRSVRYVPATGSVEARGDAKAAREFARLRPAVDAMAHVTDFVDCVLSRNAPRCPLEAARRSVDVCHLADIAMRLERQVDRDPATGRLADPRARRLARRSRRPRFTMKM